MDIIMKKECWQFAHALTQRAWTEVAAFGYCTQEHDSKDHWLYVDELFVVPQIVSSSEVDFVTDGLPYAIEKAVDDDRLHDLRFCFHSHVDMAVFFSQTDAEMIASMGKQGIPWFASVVLNKKRESNGRIDIFGLDQLDGIGSVSLEADVKCESDVEIYADAEADIKRFCERKKWTPPKDTKQQQFGHMPPWDDQAWRNGHHGSDPRTEAEKDADRIMTGGKHLRPVPEDRRLPAPKKGGSDDRASTVNGKKIIDAHTMDEAETIWDMYLEGTDWEMGEGVNDQLIYFWDGDGDYRGSAPDIYMNAELAAEERAQL